MPLSLKEVSALIKSRYVAARNNPKQKVSVNQIRKEIMEKHPEHFYTDDDPRLKQRVFFHNPFNIPCKGYIKELAYVEDLKGKFTPTQDKK